MRRPNLIAVNKKIRKTGATSLARISMSSKIVILLVVIVSFFIFKHDSKVAIASHLKNEFKFSQTLVTGLSNGEDSKYLRVVAPELEHMDAWISAVGSAVAAVDLRKRGTYDQICLVEPRNDSVSIQQYSGGRFNKIFDLQISQNDDGIAPMGCLPGDFNQDGSTDLLVYYWGSAPTLHLRDKNKALTANAFITQKLFSEEIWYTNAATTTDLNGDGNLDIVFGNYFCDNSRLLNGSGKQNQNAEDTRSIIARVESVPCNSASPMHRSMSNAANGGGNRLLVWEAANESEVSYTDQSSAINERLRHRWTLAIGAADLNEDFLPDLYFANDFGPDSLLINTSAQGSEKLSFIEVKGKRSILDEKSKVLGMDSFKGMGVDYADLDSSGRYSFAVSNISAKFALFESHFLFMPNETDLFDLDAKSTSYKDQSVSKGIWTSNWSWDLKFADFNNDGAYELIQTIGFLRDNDPTNGDENANMWAQLHEAAMGLDELLPYSNYWPKFSENSKLSGDDHDRFYVMGNSADDDWQYSDIASQIGLPDNTVSRGVAIADFNEDGKMDAVISRQWMDSTLLLNVNESENDFLSLELVYATDNGGTRPAIGASVLLSLANGGRIRSFIDGGNGHSGVREPIVHFGLGKLNQSSRIEKTSVNIEISWRDLAGIHQENVSILPGRHTLLLDQKGVSTL